VEIWIDSAQKGSATTDAEGRYRVVGLPKSDLVSISPQLSGSVYVGVHEIGGDELSSALNAVTTTCGGRIASVPDLMLVRRIAPISPIAMFATTSPGPKTLTWTAIPGATSYRVRFEASASYSNSCTISFQATNLSAPSPSYVTPFVAAGQSYGFLVRAFAGSDVIGEGDLCFAVK
jgi:hypothetical protein